MSEYKLEVEECEKLIGHCWDTGLGVFAIGTAMQAPDENREETAKQCPHCGLRELRKIVTTYRFEKP